MNDDDLGIKEGTHLEIIRSDHDQEGEPAISASSIILIFLCLAIVSQHFRLLSS